MPRPRLKLWFADIVDGSASRRALRLDHLGGDVIMPTGWSILIRRPDEISYPLPEQFQHRPWQFEKNETFLLLDGRGADAFLHDDARRPTYWMYLQRDDLVVADGSSAQLLDPRQEPVASTESPGPSARGPGSASRAG